jgi:predicted phage terminase large subunit-like protein
VTGWPAPLGQQTTPTPSEAPSLAAYVEQTTAHTLEGWQRLICTRLERLVDERGARVLIHGPPQFGKSLIISQRFPAWALGKRPLLRLRTACYNVSHAERFTKVCLGLLRETAPSDDARPPAVCPANEWSTEARARLMDANPSMLALGLGTGFTGLGVDILIVDDPYKNAQEARSPAVNVMLRDWWTNVVTPRLNPDANVVVMFHRWWEGDFAGWLMEQGGWEMLRFPAIADAAGDDPTRRAPGELLSPRFTRDWLAKQRREMGTAFDALYQGTPYPAEGSMFKVGKVAFVDAPPSGAVFVRGWDIGASAGTGDPTASALLYRKPGGGYGVAHAMQGQWATDERDAQIKATAELDRATWGAVTQDLPQDPGAAGKSQALAFVKLLAGFTVKTSTESGDKATRADPLSSQWNAGQVEIVRGPWNQPYIDAMCAFPQGKDDHYTDASSRAFARLAEPILSRAIRPTVTATNRWSRIDD